MADPLVSVIVPTRNSEPTIDKCLDSISKQTYSRLEIIIVDNYSTDRTVEIARRYTANVFLQGPERSSQVNYGVTASSGAYVYEVGSDFVLADDNLIAEAVLAAETGNYGAVLIHNTSDPTVSYWAKVRKFERDMYLDDDTNVAVRFIRREVFLEVGGFDPNLVAGEDYDLHNRIIKKYPITRISSHEIHLGEPRSLKELVSKHYYYGKSVSSFIVKNKKRGLKQIMPIRAAYLRHSGEFARHPDLAAGFFVYQLVRYAASACGIVASKIHQSPT